jgi:hypothetical protein
MLFISQSTINAVLRCDNCSFNLDDAALLSQNENYIKYEVDLDPTHPQFPASVICNTEEAILILRSLRDLESTLIGDMKRYVQGGPSFVFRPLFNVSLL